MEMQMDTKKIYYETIKNEMGQPQEVLLDQYEQELANELQAAVSKKLSLRNALGYEISITTLTTIMKKITEQKFFQNAPADFLPVRVGEGAWSSNLVTYRDYDLADDFSSGLLNMGTNNSRLASVNAGVDSLSIPVHNWAKQIEWSIMDLQQAAKSGNWDIVTSKEKARKRNFDLGVQRLAFLGLGNGSQTQGLLNQDLNSQIGGQITINTTLITGPLSALAGTPSTLATFIQKLIATYQANCQYTAMPTHFVIPQSDFLGLAGPSSPDFPIKSTLDLMEEAFRRVTGNQGFKILGLPYCDASVSGGSNQVYALYNYEEESLRMDIPVSYTNTMENSINNFQFQSVGYAQVTGALAYRPAELMYFRYAAS
jgi:hypothetical protein